MERKTAYLEEKIIYFETAGRENTEETLRLVAERARARGISKIVLASTRGDTARLVAERFAGTGIKMVVVPHQYGFIGEQRFPMALVSELEQKGHRVHFGTMLFHTDGFYGITAPSVMATLLRTFCQGMKVCIEIILMAVDGGCVAAREKVIAVTGTGRGADTAVVAIAAPSTRLSELHITEIEKQRQDANQLGVLEAELQQVKHQLKALDREQEQLLQWALKGFPEETVIAENKKINGKRETLKAQKAELETQIKASQEAAISLPKVKRFIELIQDKISTLDFESKRQTLDMLGIKVWLDGESVEITGVLPTEDSVIATTPS